MPSQGAGVVGADETRCVGASVARIVSETPDGVQVEETMTLSMMHDGTDGLRVSEGLEQ